METKLIADFLEIRRVGTPFCLVLTSDYRGVQREFIKAEIGDEDPNETKPLVAWDCISGHVGLNKAGREACSSIGDTKNAPSLLLEQAIGLPDNTILFFVIPDQSMLDPLVTQAIANLRDEFKRNFRTLVMLAKDVTLPPLLEGDVTILRDLLPAETELKEIATTIAESQKIKIQDYSAVVERCQGLTRFAAEEGLARKLRGDGFDLKGLGELQQVTVEESTRRALLFEKSKLNYSAMGGHEQLKKFMKRLFDGPKRPSIIVRIDEIEKSISAAASGTVADNTGVSQDMLKVLLTSLEDNGWIGLLALGSPGSGKTLSSICTGNEFGARTLVLDLGAIKGSLVGETERRIREVVDILYSLGKDKVLFIATCNRLDTLPPELQARFTLGTWFWDIPDLAERDAIWKIQQKAYNVSGDKPNDAGWVGRDIRNCCRTAWMLNTTLKEASEMISIAGKANKADIEKLQEQAERLGFLSTTSPGTYTRDKKQKERAIRMKPERN